jgi:Family of unknown function (DUF5670)
MLWAVIVILLILWAGGFFLNLVGASIHLLLLLAVLIGAYQLFIRPRRAA